MRMGELFEVPLTEWEERLVAAAFLQGAAAEDLAVVATARARVVEALSGLRRLPRREATTIALEALIIGERR
jgi:hypothetical protein